jgi:hypothetical protein
MSKPFAATLKDMVNVSPSEFLKEVDAPPTQYLREGDFE